MTRQNIVITIAVAVVCFAGGYWLAAPGKLITPNVAKNTAARETGAGMHIVSIRDTTSSQLYRITGEYPQFGDAAGSLDEAIAHFVTVNLTQFKNDAAANQKAREATMPAGSKNTLPPQSFYFTTAWQPEQINDRYVSVIARIEYFDGGANETQLLQTFDYDVARKKMMTLADLFPNVPDYLRQIASLAEDQLNHSLQSAGGASLDAAALQMLKDGAAPTTNNYANFTFNDDAVTLYFPKYQVAPGVFGEQKVTIARSIIRSPGQPVGQ